MPLKRRGKWYHISEMVNGAMVREALGTKDHRVAKQLYKDRIAELMRSNPDPSKLARNYAQVTVAEAVQAYAKERRPSVKPRTVQEWIVSSRPLAEHFKDLRLKRFTAAGIAVYQSQRLEHGMAPKTVNNEVALLRQLLKKAKLWHRFKDEIHKVKGGPRRQGRALTEEEQARLFSVAQSKPQWLWAYTAAVLAFFAGMRPVEIRHLRWQDIDWGRKLLTITVSKTPEGWRTPSLNSVCLKALETLFRQAQLLSISEPEHYVFPHHSRFVNGPKGENGLPDRVLDPTRPMTSWKKAWQKIREAAALGDCRFYDGRHTVITTLQEKGVPDWVIQAQVGHVSPEEAKPYSHIRRKALEQVALVLEPTWIDRTKEPGDVPVASIQ